MPTVITMTAAACEALAQVCLTHGDIILHVTGGWCARTPMVLKKNDLHLGPHDVLLGTVAGVPVYQMRNSEDAISGPYVLDLVDGMPIGFSLAAAPGKQFVLNSALSPEA